MTEAAAVEQEFANRPLYDVDFDLDYQGPARTYTVTVAGFERLDGEKPYTYVVNAKDQARAWIAVLSHHIEEQEDIDSFIVAGESFEGAPAEDCGYEWNDLRTP